LPQTTQPENTSPPQPLNLEDASVAIQAAAASSEPKKQPIDTPQPVTGKQRGDFNRNNLDCLRLILASIVCLYHAYVLSDIRAFAGYNKFLSAPFAVKAFFVISGLLIYRSYTKSSSVRSYFEKRARRIYPAYFTVVVIAAFALLPLSTLSPAHYFRLGFLKYLCANLLFLNFLAPTLPGVFTANSMPAVNGALWTLKIEVAFYLFVPVLHWLCGRFGTKKVMVSTFALSCAWKFGFALLARMGGGPHLFTLDSSRNVYAQLDVQFPAQLAYFVAGTLLMLYFDKLKSYFGLISCITAALYLVDHWFTGGLLDVFWISGVVFVIGFWRYFGNFAKFGDFSYGVYIVHFPIIQTMIALGMTRLHPAIFLLSSLFLVFLAAFLMWHLVEKRFLKSSSHYRQVGVKVHG
jgi:peptidoglycan/LPS O-acetylase OafA/YrhL